MEKLLYKPEEAAALCSVGRSTIYEVMRTGELESIQLKSSRRIPAQALEAYIAKLRRAAPVSAR